MLNGPDLRPEELDEDSRNVLHHAARTGLADLCKELVYREGMQPTRRDRHGIRIATRNSIEI